MARNVEMKKAVVFIVEGRSDKNALEHIFKVIYKHKNVTFEFTRGDLTSDETLTIEDLERIIYEKVEAYMKEKKLGKKDIWQISSICGESKSLYEKRDIDIDIDIDTVNFFYNYKLYSEECIEV